MQYFPIRGFRVLLVAVLVAIGAGIGVESGSAVGSPTDTLRAAIDSLGSSPDLQASFSVRLPDLGTAASEVESGVVHVDVESADGHTPIRGLKPKDLNEQISISEGASDLADIRVDGADHLYFRLFFGAISNLASVPSSAKSSLATIGALIGGTWFAIPPSLITGLEHEEANLPGGTVPKTSLTPTQQQKVMSDVMRWEHDLLGVTHISSAPVPAGTATSASASLSDLARVSLRDLVPIVTDVSPKIGADFSKGIATGKSSLDEVTGTALGSVVTDGSGTMRSAQLSVTSHGQQGSVAATFDHQPIDLGPPADARPLPPAILSPIERELHARSID